MKTGVTPHWYISGPHFRDYYLLLDGMSSGLKESA
jgi:DNA-binding ferritin-like protein